MARLNPAFDPGGRKFTLPVTQLPASGPGISGPNPAFTGNTTTSQHIVAVIPDFPAVTSYKRQYSISNNCTVLPGAPAECYDMSVNFIINDNNGTFKYDDSITCTFTANG